VSPSRRFRLSTVAFPCRLCTTRQQRVCAVDASQLPWPDLIDDGLESRGNINTAALVAILLCDILVARCSRQLIGPAD